MPDVTVHFSIGIGELAVEYLLYDKGLVVKERGKRVRSVWDGFKNLRAIKSQVVPVNVPG
jgi:hypothetical protein